MGALDSVRVIDFGHYIAGPLAGMLLADQGAEVIKVDLPDGPVFDTPANATWNRGKKGISLDLRLPADAEIARELITGADVVIENFRPGTMARFGLDPKELLAVNPRLIYSAMPGFAEQDPRSSMPAWEGVVMAALDVFRPLTEYRNMVEVLHQQPTARKGTPAFTSEPIASGYAAMLSAVAISAALIARQTSGKGQRVEVPLFDALLQAVGVFAMSRLPFKPTTGSAFSGFDHQYQCKDGRWFHIVCSVPSHCEAFLRDLGREDLIAKGFAAKGMGAKPELNQQLTEFLTTTFLTQNASDWETRCQAIGIAGVEARSTKDWFQHPQAIESDLLTTVNDPKFGAMRQPGLQVKLSATPGSVRGPAPLPDQHRAEILVRTNPATEISKTTTDTTNAITKSDFPLEGLKVLDLCIILAGPTCGRTLAELGADVIKIDDPNRGDVLYHQDINRGKRSLLLDLKTREGLELFWQLVDTTDVIVQNYRTDVVERLGIDYNAVRQRKPNIIYVSLNAYGDSGPMANQPGYEEAAQALTGMQVRYGGADKPILWPYGVVNDYGTGYAGAFGVLLALSVRNTQGIGQEISSALARTACTLQSAYMQDYADKQWDEPTGPATLGFSAAQRLYQCNDGWIYVGARSIDTLAQHLGIANDKRFLDQMIVWCSDRSALEAERQLTAADIGVQPLHWLNEVASSPAVQARNLIVAREHGRLGMLRTTGPGPWFGESTVHVGRPAPRAGADAEAVFAELGRTDLVEMIELGVVQVPSRDPST